jgi:hypothetical protein
MFTSLRLGAGLVTSDQKKSRVHDSSSCEHSSHEHIMAWAINEGDVPDKLKNGITAKRCAFWVVLFLRTK